MSDGVAIARTFVTAHVKMPGIQKDVAKLLGAVDTSSVGKSIGQRFAGSIQRTLKMGGMAAGAALTAGIATAAVKGFQRLNAIDVAEKKMTGLGFSAAASAAAMKNALASVKGTSRGLGDAATVASQLMAANIKPGAQLETVLKSVANTASAAGVGMGEMGSIFAKVSSLGKAQNDVLQQVADRGLPIYQKLAEQLGVTTDEVFKMASQGKIGFADFEKAMTSAAGNVAANMGNTVGGSWANFLASLGRIGACIFGGVFPLIAPALQAITSALGPVEDIAARVGDKIGNFLAPMVEKFTGLLSGGFDFSKFAELASYLSPVGLALKALAPVLPIVGGALADIGAVLMKALAPVLPTVGKLLGDVGTIIGDTLATVLPILLPPLTDIVAVVGKLISALLPPLANLITIGAKQFQNLWKILGPVAEILLNALVPIIGALVPIIEALAPIIGILAKAFTPLLEILGTLLVPIVGVLGEVLKWAAGIISGVIVGAVQILAGVFQGVAIVFTEVWNAISSPVDYIKKKISEFGLVVSFLWTNYVQPYMQKVGYVFQYIWATYINPIITWIRDRIRLLGIGFQIMQSIIATVWGVVTSKISSAWRVC